MTAEVPPYTSTRLTALLGLALAPMLALLFFSGFFFWLYVFNFNLPPWFTPVRFLHFYVGLASIPILLAKCGSTLFRFGGYYLRMPRFKAAGPPALIPRIISPLLAADFLVLYFSGLYMLFHYYYTVTNIWPIEARPVQLHFWAAAIGAPLVTIHFGWHIVAALRSVLGSAAPAEATQTYTEQPGARTSRRAALALIGATGLGLALVLQNTRARSWEIGNLFIGRIPKEERGGPGDFPVETLFGRKDPVDVANYRLSIEGEVDHPLSLTYDDLLALPAQEYAIRISCVSGWTEVPRWRGPRVRDVLALAGERRGTKSVAFHSLSGYGWTWHRNRLNDDCALLATHVNGAPISTNHGFPIRLIVPGYPGENMVKQLDRIFVRKDGEPFKPDYRIVAAGPHQPEVRA